MGQSCFSQGRDYNATACFYEHLRFNIYVTDNKIYCIYNAANEEAVKEHATKGGFPANSVAQVKRIIDPTSAEG